MKEGVPLSIRHPKSLVFGGLLVVFSLILNLPYPHAVPLGETWLGGFGRSSITTGLLGVEPISVVCSILFFAGLLLLLRSFPHQGCLVLLIVLLLGSWGPSRLLSAYQYAFGQGIMALEYHRNNSDCNYTRQGEHLRGTCRLVFENHGGMPAEATLKAMQRSASSSKMIPEKLTMNSDTLSIPPRTTKEIILHFATDHATADLPTNAGFPASSFRFSMTDGVHTREL